MSGPTVEFWNERFRSRTTGWDRGGVHPQLLRCLASGELLPCRILVPGCGAGHEVLHLAAAGFEVTALDYAQQAIDLLRQRLREQGLRAEVLQADVRQWEAPQPFDVIWEQTCLCALYPDDWNQYAQRLHRWLAPQGRLFAQFMQTNKPGAEEGWIQGPPYHCDILAMRAVFPSSLWEWPKPPYPRVPHPGGSTELALVLTPSRIGSMD
ncbi:MAG: methyltransferase domain-containing protein [Thiomonas sp.]|nr:methyltransferase domain-containing protein [Thiomonas sp.]